MATGRRRSLLVFRLSIVPVVCLVIILLLLPKAQALQQQPTPSSPSPASSKEETPLALNDPAEQKSKFRSVQVVASRIYRPIHNKLWPNTLPDPSRPEYPLPPGPLGCPFIGFNHKISSPSFGPGVLLFKLFERLGRPRIFKFFSKNVGSGISIVSGYSNTKSVLSQEFGNVISEGVPFTSKFIGERSLRFCTDKQEHQQLRKLVGLAVHPNRVSLLLPALQETAESLIASSIANENANAETIQMEDLCLSFTLMVACRHIIGLGTDDLTPDEFDVMSSQVKTWCGGLYASPQDTSWKDARAYLVEKIQGKLQSLEQHGPDGSTVSGMLFATDDDDPNDDNNNNNTPGHGRRLTKDEIIDNTLLLIFAGSETSSGTLVNCMLLLGLQPKAWSRVVQEQQDIVFECGTEISRAVLEEGMPYLDGAVRESLRLKPIVGGSFRGTTSTIIVDGYQIPAGWKVTYDRLNTHFLDPVTFENDASHMDLVKGFKPTRWMDETTRPGQEFIPFGVGPRYCLGADLALVEMKIFLAMLARSIPKFDLVYPKVTASNEIAWREKALIPVPDKGVIIQPIWK
jgi:cytochrome P450